MLTFNEASQIALSHLQKRCNNNLPVTILEQFTIVKPYGWCFFFNSIEFVKTRDHKFSLIGAWPVLILKESGLIYDLSSAVNPEIAIEEFERQVLKFNERQQL